MATTSKALARTAAATSNATLYTVPSSTTTVVTNIVVTNTASTSGTFTIKLDGVDLASGTTIAANDTIVIDLKQTLATTKVIAGSASATSINFHISGVEIA
jgi:phage-related protein